MHKAILMLLTLPLLIQAAELEERAANPGGIRVVTVDPTPEPDHIETKIIFPKKGELKTSTPIGIQVKLEGWPLGTDSEFPRKKQIYNNPDGQTLHVIIDNYPYFELNEAFITAVDDSEEYYDQTLEFDIPFDLDEGQHLIRIFPARSFCESIKDEGFATRIFYYLDADKNSNRYDITQPYLTYNEPQGNYKYSPKTPILLDFIISNVMLSRDGYKVRLTIDKKDKRTLTSQNPYFIYGLQPGKHEIRLELLDSENVLVPGPLNTVSRTITIE